MSRRMGARFATVSLFAAASFLGAVALSSCASGTDAMTGLARTTTNSVAGAVGTISLRNVYVAGPGREGGSAQVISAFFNGGAEEDELIALSSPAAAAGQPPAAPVLSPGANNIYIADGTAPTLIDLNMDLRVGAAVPVTFTFAKAGSVTLLVPVERPAPDAWAPPTTSLPQQPVAPTIPASPVPAAGTDATATAPAPTSTDIGVPATEAATPSPTLSPTP